MMFATKVLTTPSITDLNDVFWIEIFPASQLKSFSCLENIHGCSFITLINSTVIADDMCAHDADNIHERIKQLELIPLTILILITNILVLTCIIVNKKFHTPTYIFIASLDIADIFVGLVSIVTIATKANEESQRLCLARIGVTIVAISASVWSLLCVALDRYIAITRALLYKRIMTKRKTIIGITWSWLVSIATGFLPLIGWKESVDAYEQYCSFMYVLPKYYIVFVCIISALVPFVAMFVIYGKLFRKARFHIKQIQAIEKLQLGRRNSNLFGISTSTLRSVKTFAAILGCVVITWLPLIGTSLVQMFVFEDNCTLKEIIGTHLLVLGFSNSFLNPLIYALGCKDFRTKVMHLCRRRCKMSDSQVFPDNRF